MVTQDLLRESSAAISATFRPRTFFSSAMKAACSRMLKARLFEVLSKLRIAPASSWPSELYGTVARRNWRAQR